MFLSTEIFSKRRKIYTIWRETRVICLSPGPESDQIRDNTALSPGSLSESLIKQQDPHHKQTNTQSNKLLPTFNVINTRLFSFS